MGSRLQKVQTAFEFISLVLALIALYVGDSGLAAFNVAWACYLKLGRMERQS